MEGGSSSQADDSYMNTDGMDNDNRTAANTLTPNDGFENFSKR